MEILQVKSASQKKEAFSKARKFIHRGNTNSTRVGLGQTVKVKKKKSRIMGSKIKKKYFPPKANREKIPLSCEFRILSNCCH